MAAEVAVGVGTLVQHDDVRALVEHRAQAHERRRAIAMSSMMMARFFSTLPMMSMTSANIAVELPRLTHLIQLVQLRASTGSRRHQVVSATKLAQAVTVIFVIAAASCDGASSGYTEEQKISNRADFSLMAKGHSYVGKIVYEGACTPRLSPQEAYEGIDGAVKWRPIGAWSIVSTWASDGAPASSGLLLWNFINETKQDVVVGDAIDDISVTTASYDGPSAPGLDFELTCATAVGARQPVRDMYSTFSTAFLGTYALSVEETEDAINGAISKDPAAGTFEATQESFLSPFGSADAIVGPTTWPPADLPSRLVDR